MPVARSLGVRAGCLVALATALVLVGACGGAQGGAGEESAAVAEVAEYKGGDRQAKLVKGAKEEGRLLVYTSMGLADIEAIVEGFSEKYPFLDVEVYSATGEDVAQRIVTEYRAGTYRADVLEGTEIDVHKFLTEGFGQSFSSPSAKAYPSHAVDPDGLTVDSRYNFLFFAWNTDLVSSAEAPKSYADLLDPQWRGRIGIESEDQAWLATLLEEGDDTTDMNFFKKLSEQEPQVVDSHTTLAEQVAAGEVPMSPTIYSYDAGSLDSEGAPIEYRPLEPVVSFPHVISLPSNAPHPNAAMLWIDYFLSPEGQQAIADLGRPPAHPKVPTDPPRLSDGFETAEIPPDKFLSNFSEYDDLWQQYIIRQ